MEETDWYGATLPWKKLEGERERERGMTFLLANLKIYNGYFCLKNDLLST